LFIGCLSNRQNPVLVKALAAIVANNIDSIALSNTSVCFAGTKLEEHQQETQQHEDLLLIPPSYRNLMVSHDRFTVYRATILEADTVTATTESNAPKDSTPVRVTDGSAYSTGIACSPVHALNAFFPCFCHCLGMVGIAVFSDCIDP
jgi:hypothetical protein